METLLIQNAVIDFLHKENKEISLNVSEHLDINGLFMCNRSKYDSDYFETIQDLDWDEFYFEVKLKIGFGYESHHRKETRDSDEESIINFKNIDAIANILVCQKWDDISDDIEDYELSGNEMNLVKEYFENHIILS